MIATATINNVSPAAQGPIIPVWVLEALVVALFGGLVGFGFEFARVNHQKFEGEYHIKAELNKIGKNLKIGYEAKPIEIIYGAGYVRDLHLFGEHLTEVPGWYAEFKRHNLTLKDLQAKNDRSGIERLRRSEANILEGTLASPWLKKIPDDSSDLSIIKFMRYLLGRDAIEEPEQTSGENSGKYY